MPELLEYLKELAEKSELVRTGQIDPSEANMLTITNDGRKAALDIRLVVPDAQDYEDSKVNCCVDNVFRIWAETGEKKSTQLVFSDLSTPKPIEMKKNEQDIWEVDASSISVYMDVKTKLMAKGIPAKEIEFIHDGATRSCI